MSADPSSWVHVALEGGRVVGLAAVYVMPLIERDDPIARVTTIVVDHGARGRGIGRALLARLEERARARGCDRIDLTSRYDREGAAPFYRRMAFEDTSSRFVKGLN